MIVTLDLPDRVEAELRRRAAAAGMDLSAYVTELILRWMAENQLPGEVVSAPGHRGDGNAP